MIDHEAKIYSQVADVLRAKYDGIFIVGEAIDTPNRFPAVSIVQLSNILHFDSRSVTESGVFGNHAEVTFEINVYSNLTSGKKQQCKNISADILNEFAKMGFIRTFYQPIPNFSNTSIYRETARVTGIISKDGYVYTN